MRPGPHALHEAANQAEADVTGGGTTDEMDECSTAVAVPQQ